MDRVMRIWRIRLLLWIAPEIIKALSFYGEPDTYFAIMLVGDPPCGEFIDDDTNMIFA